MAKRPSNIPEGTRVIAPCYKRGNIRLAGTIQDNLTVMYFIQFDDGTADFCYKAEDVQLIENE